MSEVSKTAHWGVSWVVVTGASRGLGAAICEGVAGVVDSGSLILGLARSSQGLNDTAHKVQQTNPNVKFIPVVMDLEKASKEDLEKVLGEYLKVGQDPPPTCSIIFHNAGSLGDLVYLRNHKDSDHINSYFTLNISSVVLLNAVFLEMVSQLPDVAVEIVNISSLCAIQPFKSWSLYCAAKAARDMLFKVLAAEEPKLMVLNYAPGPLDNDMQELARSETADDEMRLMFASLKEEGKLLACSVSVNKLLEVLKKRQFKSGDHVDYYDA
ncbi:sepiapterin reductase-like [Homarus americanus]|uniref:Sepiapterin reductase n=1 Tax=Homarus americanus TaxID=6706 RepID=A0A8J5JKK9_HOMAM|nr:sepiapterin reductase-like [Homarus americanus]KAG7157766.1 Sepiapterin reductase-like [Homarus americanus]